MEWKEKRKDNVGMDKGNQENNNIGGSQEDVRCCSRKETKNQGGVKMSAFYSAVLAPNGWGVWQTYTKRSMKEFPTKDGELNNGYATLNVGDIVILNFNDGIHIVVVSEVGEMIVKWKTIKQIQY